MKRSLFWTFALSFLLVLVTATLLQGLVIFAVVEPFSALWAGERAEEAARDAAWALAELDGSDDPRARDVLADNRSGGRGTFLLLERADGELVADRPLPEFIQRHLRAVVDGEEPEFEGPPFPGGAGPPGPRGGGPRAGGPGRPGRPGPEAWPGMDEAPRDRWGRMEVLAREPVRWATGETATVLALGPSNVPSLWPKHTPRPVLFFVPIAIVLSALGGLLLFRALVRRIRALEELATRVSRGDLDARVTDPGRDEIGRLGQRLNRMTEGLADARARIEQNDAQRRRLLADVSHELATPLTSIRGYAETLLNPDVPATDDERTGFVENILDESARMDLLIQDLFELTRLEAGAEKLEKERLDWAALCEGTVKRFEARAREAGVNLRWHAGGEAWIEADGRRQERVVENLVVNALRYVPSGGTVTVSVTPVDDGRFALEVADDGPGIPEADLPHVFDRFYRADPARGTGGSGLGLAIVREIVQQHGGTVLVANRESGGALFRVELPAAQARRS